MLTVFLSSQSVLDHLHDKIDDETEEEYIAMTRLLFQLNKFTISHCNAIRMTKSWGLLPVPNYLVNSQELGSPLLTIGLVLMLALEPVIHCLSAGTETSLSAL